MAISFSLITYLRRVRRAALKGMALVWRLLLAVSVSYAQSSTPPGTFSFPGSVSKVLSGTGRFSAEYKQSAKSDEDFDFSIKDQTGKIAVQHSFTRSVEGAWSPTDANIYLNDFLGSTQIDCYVWNPKSKGLWSLTEALLRDPKSGPIEGRGAKPPETPHNSRYELTCGGWKSKDKVLVNVEGTTWAGGQFKYKLVYDLIIKQFSWN